MKGGEKGMMKQMLFITSLILILLAATVAYSQTEFHPTEALQVLTNISRFTAENASQDAYATNRNVTVATIYGGWMTNSPTPVQNIVNYGRQIWTINFTNTGNATANFTVRVVASNIYTGGNWADWNRHFNNTGGLSGLGPGAGTSFQFVISNVNPVADGAWVSYLIQVTNTSANLSARAYTNDQGTWYGWSLGVSTNTTFWATGPVVYLQNGGQQTPNTNEAGFLTVVVQGPILSISKSIQSVSHPSGLVSGTNWAEPGAIIVYSIKVTNEGSGAANNVAVIDTIPTAYLEFASYTEGSILKYYQTVGGDITFTNSTFAVGAVDTLKIVVRVK